MSTTWRSSRYKERSADVSDIALRFAQGKQCEMSKGLRLEVDLALTGVTSLVEPRCSAITSNEVELEIRL